MNFKTKGAARYTRLSEAWLRKGRLDKTGPPFVRINRTIIYRKIDLDKFLERHLQNDPAETVPHLAGSGPSSHYANRARRLRGCTDERERIGQQRLRATQKRDSRPLPRGEITFEGLQHLRAPDLGSG